MAGLCRKMVLSLLIDLTAGHTAGQFRFYAKTQLFLLAWSYVLLFLIKCIQTSYVIPVRCHQVLAKEGRFLQSQQLGAINWISIWQYHTIQQFFHSIDFDAAFPYGLWLGQESTPAVLLHMSAQWKWRLVLS